MATQNNRRTGLGTGLTGILSLQAPGTCKMISFFVMLDVIVQDFSIDLQAPRITYIQWWTKDPIYRSSETDLIIRLYRPIKSVDFKFRFLYRPIPLAILSSDSLIDLSFMELL